MQRPDVEFVKKRAEEGEFPKGILWLCGYVLELELKRKGDRWMYFGFGCLVASIVWRIVWMMQ